MQLSLPKALCAGLRISFAARVKIQKTAPSKKQVPLFTGLSFLILFSLFAINIIAQPVKQWDKTFSGNGNDVAASVIQTADGGYVIGGYADSGLGGSKSEAGRGGNDYWIVKMSASGVKEWDKTIGGPGDDILSSVKQTADGGYLLGGQSRSGIGGDKTEDTRGYNDYWVVKLNASGAKQWDKTIGGDFNELFRAMEQTPDGGYIIGGASNSGANGEKTEDNAEGADSEGYDFWIVKLRANGTIEWDKTVGWENSEILRSIDLTSDGGYILGGHNAYPEPYNSDYIIAKLTSARVLEWKKTFGGSLYDELITVRQTSDGGYILGGNSISNIGGDKTENSSLQDFWIIKTSSNGTKEWDQTLGGTSVENFAGIEQDSDGGYILGGTSSSNAGRDKTENHIGNDPNYLDDFWLAKLAPNGSKLWDKTIGGRGDDRLRSLQITQEGKYILVGNSNSPTSGDKSEAAPFNNSDYWVVKLNPELPDRLSFSSQSLTFSYISETPSPPTQAATLSANNGSPAVTLTKFAGTPWLVLPSGALGSLSFDVNPTGLAAGTYNAVVTAIAQNYASATLTISLVITNANPENVIRINAGGGAFTALGNRQFVADQYFGGIDRTSTIPGGEILNTTDDALYRSGRSSAAFNYAIPVQNGTVNVVLHFAEIWFGAPGRGPGGEGKRVFHVNVEGNRKLTNYDIYARAGGAMRAIQEIIPVVVTDGTLNIDFLSGRADMPRISAIEVIPQPAMVILPAVADAFTRDGWRVVTNYGSDALLEVKNGTGNGIVRNSYLKFSLDGLTEVNSAKLRVYGNNTESDNNVALSVYGVDSDSWTESGIVWNNAPATSTAALGSIAVNHVAKYYELDVTGFVQSQLAGDKVVSLVLKNPSAKNKRLAFHSKENATNPPQLIIEATSSPAARFGQEIFAPVTEKEFNPGKSVIFPNPVQKKFTLQVGSQHETNVSAQLISGSGRAYEIDLPEGAEAGIKTEVDISNLSLSSGIYLLKVQSAEVSEVIKVLLVE